MSAAIFLTDKNSSQQLTWAWAAESVPKNEKKKFEQPVKHWGGRGP